MSRVSATGTTFNVPNVIAQSVMEAATGLDLTQHFVDTQREHDLRERLVAGESLPAKDLEWLELREQERKTRRLEQERRKAEARAKALTVAQLIELLHKLPQDAPVSVTEYWSWGPEDAWADKSAATLQDNGSVHLGG